MAHHNSHISRSEFYPASLTTSFSSNLALKSDFISSLVWLTFSRRKASFSLSKSELILDFLASVSWFWNSLCFCSNFFLMIFSTFSLSMWRRLIYLFSFSSVILFWQLRLRSGELRVNLIDLIKSWTSLMISVLYYFVMSTRWIEIEWFSPVTPHQRQVYFERL